MHRPPEVPRLSDLTDYDVHVQHHPEPGVISVTGWAHDHDQVRLTWDELAGSAHVEWTSADDRRLVLYREAVSKISMRQERERLEFHLWFTSSDLTGELIVHLGHHVSVQDTLLES